MICSIKNIDFFKFSSTDKIKELIYSASDYTISEMLSFKKYEGSLVYDLSTIGREEVEDILSDCKLVSQALDDKIRFKVCSIADLDLFVSENIPAFCCPGAEGTADTLDKFNILCERGATDVYVGGELGFRMKDVRTLADRRGVKIRVIPNIAQFSGQMTLSHKDEESGLTSFWIRPNDIQLYDEYVDVIEFFCKDEAQHIFYETYFENKNWEGNLGEIIVGLEDLNNKYLIEDFTSARLSCGKKCLLDKCHSCFKYKRISEAIEDNNLKITKKA